MTDSQNLVKYPLCKGHGEIRRAELVVRLSHGELKSKVDSTLNGLVQPGKNSQQRRRSPGATNPTTFRKTSIVGTRSGRCGGEARRSELEWGLTGLMVSYDRFSGVKFLTADFVDFRRL
jgi:hypothetical protein